MNSRPQIKISSSPNEKKLEIAGIIFLAMSWLLAVNGLINYPDVIPVHFNANGMPDGYGNKYTLILLPCISTAIWIGISLLNKKPHIFNYPTKITEENAEEMYRSVTTLMRVIKNIIALLFLLILYMTHRVVTGEAIGIGKGFLIMALGMMILPVLFYMVKLAGKNRAK